MKLSDFQALLFLTNHLSGISLSARAIASFANFISKLALIFERSIQGLSIASFILFGISAVTKITSLLIDPRVSANKKKLIVTGLIISGALAVPVLFLAIINPLFAVILGLTFLGIGVANTAYLFISGLFKQLQFEKKFKNNPAEIFDHYQLRINELRNKLTDSQLDNSEKILIFLKIKKFEKRIKFAESHGAKALYKFDSLRLRQKTISKFVDLNIAFASLALGIIGIQISFVMPVLGPILIGLSITLFTISLVKASIELYEQIKKSYRQMREVSEDELKDLLEDKNTFTKSTTEMMKTFNQTKEEPSVPNTIENTKKPQNIYYTSLFSPLKSSQMDERSSVKISP